MRAAAWVFAVAVLFPALVFAQGGLPPDPVTTGSIQAGPVQLSPRVELNNLGVDSNIYNQPGRPVQDVTFTVRPSLGAGLRVGRGRMTSTGWLDLVYFKDHPDERAFNRFGDVRGELRFERFVPYARAAFLDTKDRPNSEIDLRARRSLDEFSGGVALGVFSRTAIFANVRRQTLSYAPDQMFEGNDLAVQLNNTLRTFEGGMRMALTVLTTLSVSATLEEQRFEFSSDRDANSTKLTARFDFDPDAVIHGTATAGYRHFDGISDTLRDYSGFIANVQVGWRYQDRTSVDLRLSRDVDYSVEDTQPYYVTGAASVIVRQRIGGLIDVQGAAGRDALHYRTRQVAGTPDEGAVDVTRTVSGGIGYWFGPTFRSGIDYEYAWRDGRDRRSYTRRRVFGSVAYGF